MMDQPPESNVEQGDSSAATPKPSLGRMLREAREHLGLNVADVAGQIKFAPRQIEALEADDFQRLPEMPFVRGFVRSYAKILHMDAQALLAALPQTKAVPVQLIPASVEVPFPRVHLSQRQNLIWLGAALLLAVLVVAFAVWHYTAPDTQAETTQVETPPSLPAEVQIIPASSVPEAGMIASPAAAMARPSSGAAQSSVSAAAKHSASQAVPQAQPTKPAVQMGASPQTTALQLVFDEESWVEIKDKDDKTLSSQVNPRGSELRLDGRAPFSLVIGHAASVRLYHRGKQVDLTPHINSSSEIARLTLK